MKKSITALMLIAALTGCEEANKAIDKAQEAANKAVDSVHEKIETVDLDALNLDAFDNAKEQAKAFAESMQDALNADLTDAAVLQDVSDQISNSYACLVEATSEGTAEKILNQVMEAIGSAEQQSLIDKAVEKAKAAKECVM